MSNEDPIVRRQGWLAEWIGEDLIMMNAESGFYLNLTGVGGHIWELLETPHTLTELCEVLAMEYMISPVEIVPEVTAFLKEMQFHRAVQFGPSTLA